MGIINLPELTEGMDDVSVSLNTEVKVNVNGSDIPNTIGYYKQQESDIVQKSIQNNAFEIYGQQGVQHYLVVVD